MVIKIFLILSGCILGSFLTFLFLKPRMLRIQFDNLNQRKRNEELKEVYCSISKDNALLQKQKETLLKEIPKIQQENQKKILEEQNFLEKTSTILKESYQKKEDEMKANFKQKEECLKQSYSKYNEEISYKIESLKNQIKENEKTFNLTVELNKKQYNDKEQEKFYKLNLSDSEINEIEKLNEVSLYLRDPIALNKTIWKVYYEKPFNDLVGRVLGSQPHCGIYKITNLINGMCYVGQSVNISERWKQHIKRGLGAEASTKNKLYPAMKEFKVENFSFQLLEDCEKNELNEKEDFWQDYCKAKEFGYSIK